MTMQLDIASGSLGMLQGTLYSYYLYKTIPEESAFDIEDFKYMKDLENSIVLAKSFDQNYLI